MNLETRAEKTLRSYSFADLRAEGMSRGRIVRALDCGALLRARRDVYVSAEAGPRAFAAARVGGRLDCVSAMRERGVFVREHTRLHVQVPRNGSRLRSPQDRGRRRAREDAVVVHWCDDPAPGHALLTDRVASLARAVRCQSPRDAVATIDSALHLGVIDGIELGDVFALLPHRYRVLRPLVDGRAESGPETLARLALRSLGKRIDVQVRISGVGRVDLVVDGWIVVECDSREFHSSWNAQAEDRRRDLALATLGYVSVRVTARMIFDEPNVLVEAVRGLLASRGRL
ncbi:hypothetical protein N8K70_03570 [Microbacterium betulae]|uniref:DUF559 domain-containing protein n=1 Tax=Microbacterium betulae TaxID=2981139 RepID=A0AA97FIQ2_9MICO|nr:hypothetical protein [Microbacterium sp. AB]WOF23770.1 hypothetical protein N8K70_03570 [Microbacterium sp. AB]